MVVPGPRLLALVFAMPTVGSLCCPQVISISAPACVCGSWARPAFLCSHSVGLKLQWLHQAAGEPGEYNPAVSPGRGGRGFGDELLLRPELPKTSYASESPGSLLKHSFLGSSLVFLIQQVLGGVQEFTFQISSGDVDSAGWGPHFE